MKKSLLTALILTLAVLAFAITPRGMYWHIDATNVNIMDAVDTIYDGVGATDPDFLLTVVCSAFPTEIKSSTDPGTIHPVVADLDGMAFAYCDQQAWVGDWPAGSTLTFTLTYLPTGLSTSANWTADGGSEVIFLTDLIGTTPGTWWVEEIFYFNLEVTSSPSGYSIHVNGVDSGFDTPHTFIDPDPATYSMSPDYFNWEPEAVSVGSLTEDMTIHFVSEPKFLEVTSNPSGQAISRNGVGTGRSTPYVFSSYAASELAGSYTLAAIPGAQWVPLEWLVTEADILAAPTGKASPAVNPERDYSLSINFELDWYALTVNSDPAGAAIHRNGANTGFLTPHVFDPSVAGQYTVQKAGWTWEPASHTVGVLDSDTQIFFLGSPPAAPSNLVATTQSSSSIKLTWTDNSSNEEGFRVERKTGSTGSWAQIASVAANVGTYTNTGLTQHTTYYYRVRAYCADVLSAYSNEAYATTLYTTPATPTNLSAEAVSSSQVDLTWTDNASVETAYRVERKTGSGGAWSQIASLGANATSYSNTGLQHGYTYYYRVRALNVNVYSGYSNEASATPVLAPTADFTAAATEVLELVEIQFSDTSEPGSGSIVSWLWDFGDGNSSTLQHPLHSWLEAGSYNVSLTVTNSFNATDTIEKTGYITILPRYPVLALSPAESIDFGLVWLGTSGSAELTLQNTGTADLLINSAELLISAGPFEIADRSYPIELAPGESTTLHLAFTPEAAGEFANLIQIHSNAPSLPLASLNVYGSCQIPEPLAPAGVTLIQGQSGATLSWEPVTQTVQGTPLEPSYYFIYRCSQPFGVYELFGVTQGLSYSLDLGADMMFYHVKAVKFYRGEDVPAALGNFLDN